MKSNKTYLYLLVFAVLLAAAYFITSDKGEKTSSYELKDKKLFVLDSVKVDKIEIKSSGGDLVLSKSTGEWKTVSPVDYMANTELVNKAISSLKNFNIESIISTNPAKKDTYGFNENNQAEISVYEGGNLKGKFLMGNAAVGTSSYIKKMDSDNIYITDALERTDFVKPDLNEWREKNIVSIPKQSVNSIEFISPEETFTVSKDASGKYFVGTDSVTNAFDGILNLLENFQTTNFADTLINDESAFKNIINIDNGNKNQIKFLMIPTTPVKYYVKVEGDKQIYELEDGAAKNLLKTKKDITGK